MKGLILSLAVFVAYVFVTAILSHWLRPQRPSRLFPPIFLFFSLIYAAAYWFTPQDLYFLGPGWISAPLWLDAIGGFIILIMNYFSYIDWFFGFNGGFSMSLMLEILRTDNRSMSTEELVHRYLLSNEDSDKILSWRIPRLEETGYIVQDRQTGIYQLTYKGRIVVWLTDISKRFLNLGAGG